MTSIAPASWDCESLAALDTDPALGPEQVDALEKLRAMDWGPHVRATAAKIFADGVIESGTAALLEPYLAPQHGRGELNFEPDRLTALAIRLDRAGFQIHVHAIGDRAIRATFEALAAARRENGARDARHLLAHIELFAPDDIQRFRELGAIAALPATLGLRRSLHPETSPSRCWDPPARAGSTRSVRWPAREPR